MATPEGQSNAENQSDHIREFVGLLAGFMKQQAGSKEAQTAAQEESIQQQAAVIKAMSEEIQRLQEGLFPTTLQEFAQAPVSKVPMNPFPVAQKDDRGIQQFRQFVELRTPHFSGMQNPLDAEIWLGRVVKDLTVIGCDIQYWVPFATFLLEGEAALWWSSVLSQMEHPIVWDDFVEEFDDQYFPSWYQKQKEMEFWYLRQGSMTVTQYEAKFTALFRFASHEFTEEDEKVKKFEAGLRDVIRRKVQLFYCTTYKEIVKKAMIIEENESDYSKSLPTFPPENIATHQAITLGKRKVGETSDSDSKISCYRCGLAGHFAWNCSGPKRRKLDQHVAGRHITATRSRPSKRRITVSEKDNTPISQVCCFRCGETGHVIRSCPYRNSRLPTQLRRPVTISEEDFTSVGNFYCHLCRKAGHLAGNCPHRNAKELDQLADDTPISTTCFPHAVTVCPPTPLPVRPVRLVSWRGPHPGIIRLNVDGCSRGNPGPSAAGGIFRDHTGTILAAFGCFLGHHNSLYAELVAVLKGLTYVSELGFSNVEVESDSLEVVDWVTDSNQGRYGFAYVIRSIRKLTKRHNIKIKHVLREANQAADFMANWACSAQVTRLFTSRDEFPPGLVDITSFDATELPCLRE